MEDRRMRIQHPRMLKDGEHELIAELYPSLRRFASAVRPPGQDGNDLVQEALLRTLRSKGSLMALDNPGAYVRRTIVNLAKDQQRSEARRRTAWSKLGSDTREVPHYYWELEELRLVSPKSRAVLYLRIIEGWPYADIGEMLGCSQVSARVAASRGKRQLEAALSKEVRDATA
jgi:DNA-directed RNA polymerase specialized sigma24 family protein